MKYFLLVIILTYSQSDLLSQQDKRGNTWVIGLHLSVSEELMELDFNGDSVSIETYVSDHSMAEPSITSYCNSDGEILLYSNGCAIYDRNHKLLENGDNLAIDYDLFGLCESIGYTGNTEGVMFVPHPCNDNLVHLIYLDQVTENFDLLSRKLMVTSVDISSPNKPIVVDKNRIIYEGVFEKGSLAITKHQNGKDWWICLLELKSNCYDCFQLSELGFSAPVKTCTGPFWGESSEQSLGDGVGPIVFSPNGSSYVRFNFEYGLNIYDFNNATGILDHREQIFLEEDDFLGFVGAAISPSSQYLYASAKFRLYQFDLFADTIEHTGQIVDTSDIELENNHTFRLSRLAPDGKIYIAGFNSLAGLHVIHHPDREGLACEVEQLGLRFPEGIIHLSGLPNNPWYGEVTDTSLCDSLDAVVSIDLGSTISLFPNPTSDAVHITIPDNLKVQHIELMDTQGRVQEQTYSVGSDVMIDLYAYPAGLYFITIDTDMGRVVKKIVKE